MYKIITTLLLVAFFASNTAFASNGKPVNPSTTESINVAPDNMLSLKVNGPFTGNSNMVANWTADNAGPFTVILTDLTTNTILVNTTTNLFTWTFPGALFTHGDTYRVAVGDGAGFLIFNFLFK